MTGIDGNQMRIASSLFAHISPTHQKIVDEDCDSTWLSNLTTGQKEQLSKELYGGAFVWSSDGTALFYEQGEDIWAIDLQSGENRNITNTPDHAEYAVRIWPARPDVLLFYSNPIEGDYGEGWFGYPSILNLDETRYTVLTTSPSLSVALAPNGQEIAYADDQGVWLYTNQTGKQPFPLAEYGLSNFSATNFRAPAWSPNGRWLTWWVKTRQNSEEIYTPLWKMILIDLEQKTSRVIGDFVLYLYGHWPDAPEWSPDSRWLVFWSGDDRYERVGIWKVSMEDKHAKLLAEFDNRPEYDISDRAWSPNGQWLAFTQDERGQNAGIWIADIETGESINTGLPGCADLMDWINLEPLQTGKQFVITPSGANLNVRTSPSLAGGTVATLNPGDIFSPLEGPVSADNYLWWRIREESSGIEGWIVDIQDWYAPLDSSWSPNN